MNNYLNFNTHKQVAFEYRNASKGFIGDTSKMLAPAGGNMLIVAKENYPQHFADVKESDLQSFFADYPNYGDYTIEHHFENKLKAYISPSTTNNSFIKFAEEKFSFDYSYSDLVMNFQRFEEENANEFTSEEIYRNEVFKSVLHNSNTLWSTKTKPKDPTIDMLFTDTLTAAITAGLGPLGVLAGGAASAITYYRITQ